MSAKGKTIPTLEEFVKIKKRENCNVCKLPVEIRGQIGRGATLKKISRDQQVEWVALVTGKKITVEELTSHVSGRHDA